CFRRGSRMKFKIKFADQIVGIFSLIALACLIFFIFLIGSKQKWFMPKHNFYTVTQSASNITEGMALNYKGFSIGKVTKISLQENDTVRVDFYISDEYHKKTLNGSVIELQVSPIGLGSSLIYHPGIGPELLIEDSLIPEISSEQGIALIKQGSVIIDSKNDSISGIVASAGTLMTNVNKLITQISDILAGDPSYPVSGILKNMNNLTSQMSDVQGLIPKLLESTESAGTVDALFAALNQTMGEVKGITNSLNNEMPQVAVLLAQVQVLLTQVQDVLEGVKNIGIIKSGVPDHGDSESTSPKAREAF
ncbi:MAG: MlaD family protein, partial [Treponemataceae bacterium]|nr:MlaD family protein [Treponemataceae bacterium]